MLTIKIVSVESCHRNGIYQVLSSKTSQFFHQSTKRPHERRPSFAIHIGMCGFKKHDTHLHNLRRKLEVTDFGSSDRPRLQWHWLVRRDDAKARYTAIRSNEGINTSLVIRGGIIEVYSLARKRTRPCAHRRRSTGLLSQVAHHHAVCPEDHDGMV